MCATSASSRSPFLVRRISTIRRPDQWPVDSPPSFSWPPSFWLPSFWPTDPDSSVSSHFSSCPAVMLTAACQSSQTSSTSLTRSLLLQGTGLVDRLAAALVALDEVLRLVLRGLHRAPRCLGLGGDLLLHLALGLAP